jgi:chlorocatechol 1,2-dioxygenase
MATNRVETVVGDIIDAVRSVLDKHDVTFGEYRAAVGFLARYNGAAPYEIPLCLDLFFNAQIHDIEMKSREGSVTAVEGPYFREDCPDVEDALQVLDGKGEAMIIEGKVTDLAGKPLENAEVWIWHSDPDGYYSGFAPHMPQPDFYRGHLRTRADGTYRVKTSVPAPYTIPHDGPTGALLAAMGRHPWRPAHVHFKVKHPSVLDHITQSYFQGGDYVEDDCVEGVRPSLIHKMEERGGVKILRKDFVLDLA